MNAALEDLQRRLGHRFQRPELLSRALTHRSYGADHNERLEFLGDAVLSLAVSSLLYERYAGSDEGDLTRVRAHLVREDSLHKLALGLGLPGVLKMSDGEARGGGAQRPSILADAVGKQLAQSPVALLSAAPSAAEQPEAQRVIGPVKDAVKSAGGTAILPAQPWVLTATQIRVLQARGHAPGSYAMVAVAVVIQWKCEVFMMFPSRCRPASRPRCAPAMPWACGTTCPRTGRRATCRTPAEPR